MKNIVIVITFALLLIQAVFSKEQGNLLNYSNEELLSISKIVISRNSKILENKIKDFSETSRDFDHIIGKPKVILNETGIEKLLVTFCIATPCQGLLHVYLDPKGDIEKGSVKFFPWDHPQMSIFLST